MYFNHYTNRPVQLAVQLVNTPVESIDELDEYVELLDEYRDLWEWVAQPPREEELESLLRLRSALREVITAEDEVAAAKKVNRLLADHGAVPRVSLHSGEPHLHFEPVNSSMHSWLATTTSMGLAAVIVEHGVERFGSCGAADCDDVYVDTSRNKSRRHCSNTCSTREAVAAHRARKAE